MLKVNWKKDFPGTGYSSYTGKDEAGNTYYLPASGEFCDVETTDGRKARGWNEREALALAMAQPIPAR